MPTTTAHNFIVTTMINILSAHIILETSDTIIDICHADTTNFLNLLAHLVCCSSFHLCRWRDHKNSDEC